MKANLNFLARLPLFCWYSSYTLIFLYLLYKNFIKLKHPKIKLCDIQILGALSSLKLMLRTLNDFMDIELYHFFLSLLACILHTATNSSKGRCEFYFIYFSK